MSLKIFTAGNLLTLANLGCGMAAIVLVATGDLWFACWFLLLGATFDFFDGKIAKHLGQASDLGLELDSLADMVTFGVAPPALVFAYHTGAGEEFPLWVFIPVLAFVYCSIWRLAKYNIQRDKSYFMGMPTTLNGVFLPVIYVCGAAEWMWAYLLLAAVLMNLPVRLPNWGR